MTRIKTLIAAALLTFVLAVAAGGQQPPACNPGETHTPPCPSAPATTDESFVVPEETLTPPEGQSFEFVSLVEFAFDMLLLA